MEIDLNPTLFIEHFHSLDGLARRDRRRQLNLLLLRCCTFSENEIEQLCSTLNPQTYLEEIFRIEILIHFKRQHLLLKELQSGNALACKLLAKHDWFFQNAFENYSPEVLVNAILPIMPYSARLIILQRFKGQTDEINDKILDQLEARYGLSKSIEWIPKCSAKKIEKILTERPDINLSANQLKILYKKDRNLLLLYCQSHELDAKYNHLMNLVAKEDHNLLIRLWEKGARFYRLGRRATCHFIKSNRSEIVNNPSEFYSRLHCRTLLRQFGMESTIFAENLFPTQITGECTFSDYIRKFSNHLPKRIRFQIFETTYNRTFCRTFGQDPENVFTEIIEKIITDPNLKEKYAKLQFSVEHNLDLWKLYLPATCYKEFMEQLPTMTVGRRANCVRLVTESCIYHGNGEILEKMAELVATRFKNDSKDVTQTFLHAFYYANFTLDSDKFWNNIMQCFSNFSRDNFYAESFLRPKYWIYLIKNNRCVKDDLFRKPRLLEQISFHYLRREKACFKQLLIEIFQAPQTKQLLSSDNKKLNQFEMNVLTNCFQYLKRCGEDRINLLDYPILRDLLIKALKTQNDNVGLEEIICDVLKYEQKSEHFFNFIKKVVDCLFALSECKKRYYFDEVVVRLLNSFPKVVQMHFDKILRFMLNESQIKRSLRMSKLMKRFSHLNFNIKLKECCLANLQDKNVIIPLASCTKIEEFWPMVEKWKDKNGNEVKFALKCFFSDSLIPYLLKSGHSNFPDFTICRKNLNCLNEVKSLKLVRHLNETNAVYVCLEVNNLHESFEMLQKTGCKSIIPAMLNCTRNPSERAWNIFETKLSQADKKDLKRLLRKEMHLKYKGRFITAMWRALVQSGHKPDSTEMKKLLDKIDEKCIGEIASDQINLMIIELIKEIGELHSQIILLMANSKDFAWLDHLSNLLSELKKDEKWHEKLYCFTHSIYLEYCKENVKTNVLLIDNLINCYLNQFNFESIFSQYVTLTFLKFKGGSLEDFAVNLLKLQHNVVEKCGDLVVFMYYSIILEHCRYYFYLRNVKENNVVYTLAELILPHCTKQTDYLLAINLMCNSSTPDNVVNYVRRQNVVDKIQKDVGDRGGRIALYSYLKK